MENIKKIFWNKAMFWGFIIALAKPWVEIGIYVLGIILCALAFKSAVAEDTPFPYGKALGLGVSTMLFASIILAVFTFVFFSYIDPGLVDEGIAVTGIFQRRVFCPAGEMIT